MTKNPTTASNTPTAPTASTAATWGQTFKSLASGLRSGVKSALSPSTYWNGAKTALSPSTYWNGAKSALAAPKNLASRAWGYFTGANTSEVATNPTKAATTGDEPEKNGRQASDHPALTDPASLPLISRVPRWFEWLRGPKYTLNTAHHTVAEDRALQNELTGMCNRPPRTLADFLEAFRPIFVIPSDQEVGETVFSEAYQAFKPQFDPKHVSAFEDLIPQADKTGANSIIRSGFYTAYEKFAEGVENGKIAPEDKSLKNWPKSKSEEELRSQFLDMQRSLRLLQALWERESQKPVQPTSPIAQS